MVYLNSHGFFTLLQIALTSVSYLAPDSYLLWYELVVLLVTERFTILMFFKDGALVKKKNYVSHITWKLSYSPNPFMLFIYSDGKKLTYVLRASLLISFQLFSSSFPVLLSSR